MDQRKQPTVEDLRKALETIDLKAEAGLCCFSPINARAYLQDIRRLVGQLNIQGGLTSNRDITS